MINKFGQFFNAEDLNTSIGRKADVSMVMDMKKNLADVRDFYKLRLTVEDFEEKIKHLSVFASELANLMIP